MLLESKFLRRLSFRSALAYYLYERLAFPRFGQADAQEDRRQLINQAVEDLRQHGIAVLPQFYETDYMDALRPLLLNINQEVSDGAILADSNLYSTKLSFSDALLRNGTVRIHNVDRRLPQVLRFAKEPLFLRIGALACGAPITRKTTIYQYNQPGGAKNWHLDFHANPFKAFLYVTDVTADYGPLISLPGSHQVTWSNMKRLYRYLDGGEVPHSEVVMSGYLPTSHPAPRGTVVLLDTRMIHQGGHVIKGYRCVLVNYYWFS